MSRELAAPRYWPTWAGLMLLWLGAKLLPYGLALRLGGLLGRLGCRLIPRRRHIAEVNLQLCYPELSEAERSRLVRRHFESLGVGLLTSGFAWWASDAKLRPLVRIEGLEHLEQAIAQGHGAILLGAHFTDLEISGRLMSLHHPCAVMYRRHENPVIERAFSRNRQYRFTAVIPRDDIRLVVRTLRNNHAVWYAPDQSFRGPNSTLAPFFGIPAATNTGTSRLAKVAHAPVLLFIGYRLPGSQGYRLVIQPPLADFPTDDPQADATRINGLIEQAIRVAPEQYLWIHRRFKKREGMADPY